MRRTIIIDKAEQVRGINHMVEGMATGPNGIIYIEQVTDIYLCEAWMNNKCIEMIEFSSINKVEQWAEKWLKIINPVNEVPDRINSNVIYFKAVTSDQNDGFIMCSCGSSGIDNKNYEVTTENLHADEVPELCMDAKTFAELVAKLLNEYYNKNQ
ncbi:MAG TPA: hypothetical protein PK210_05125 [Bacteroidia bacterium]|nr:hypothetical protein [Bacteroidia bacterium]